VVVEDPMTFKLACGDVMPGCAARFETDDQDLLMQQVAAHAAEAHGITEVTPDIAAAVAAKIVRF
jgi:predicted small metal-binding protein